MLSSAKIQNINLQSAYRRSMGGGMSVAVVPRKSISFIYLILASGFILVALSTVGKFQT